MRIWQTEECKEEKHSYLYLLLLVGDGLVKMKMNENFEDGSAENDSAMSDSNKIAICYRKVEMV